MTNVIAVSIAAAGLVFSLSVALLIEELIFGAVFRLFFGARGWASRHSRKQTATEAQAAGFEHTGIVGGGR
jgi:hypothetical protein